MPSFHAAQMPYQFPNHSSRFGSTNNGSFQEYQGSLSAYINGASQDLQLPVGDSYERYKHPITNPASMYSFPNGHMMGSMNMPGPVGAHSLPPLHVNDHYQTSQAHAQQRRQFNDQTCQGYPAQQEEKAVGGVSAKLDYDMEQMTDFVAEMAVGMYEIYKSRICIADIDLTRSIKPGIAYPSSFRKWILQVLNATRLPSATILLSLSYLTLRIRGLSATTRIVPTERSLYQLLTVALILGSKFLDDNTFQNKSWAEVSNIPVVELNKDERDWLSAFNHRLHFDSDIPDGYLSWEKQWKTFKARAASMSATLQSIETELSRQSSFRQPLVSSVYPYQSSRASGFSMSRHSEDGQYHSQSYSPYGPWVDHRATSAIDSSPSTAPHTGPNTPDFYGGQNGWGPIDTYSSRQEQYALESLSQFSNQLPAHPAAYQTSNFNHAVNGMWNCHSAACQCTGCRSQAQFLQPRYGPIVVG